MPCTLSASVFRPGILAQSTYCGWKDATQFDEVILPCGIDHIAPPLLMQLRPNGIIR
jgi:protein-L-isoaspartate O-methyltransferase